MNSKLKRIAKRLLSGFVAAAIAIPILPQIPAFAETGATTYSYDGYDVEYSVYNEWDNGQTVQIKVTNTGEDSILNWAFKYDAEGEITNLWNAAVYDQQGEDYIIKNSGWNYEIAPGQSVNFGYTLVNDEFTTPDSFTLCSKRVEKTSGYEVDFNVVDQWNTGIKAELAISNTSDQPLEAWTVSFDSNFTINNLWDGRLLESADNHYTVASEMWTNPIAPGNSKKIGFTALIDSDNTPELLTKSLTCVIIDKDGVVDGDTEINWDDTTDTDSDGLPDSIEEYLGSDSNNIDTDGDGLNDYYEVFGTFTDSTKADTNDDGVYDGDEDLDEDGLTSLEEFENKTNPSIADTDGDGLNDGNEVNTYGTDPLVADTDGDDLDDGDEIVFGTDPLEQDTDGDETIDSKEKFQQTLTHKVKNDDCAVTEVIIDMECTGNINRTTSVESVMNTDILCTDVVGLVGEPFEIETDSEFDKATLTFKIDKDKLGNIPFDNLLFLWYNEKENEFVELETTLNEENGTASVVTTHFSKYMVVDRQTWFNNWREIYERFEKLSGNNPSITAICVDCSGSMSWNDPFFTTSDHSTTCYRNLAVKQFAEAMFARDKTSIITFASSAREVCTLTSDKELLKSKANFYSSGGTNANAAINIAVRQLAIASGNRSIVLMSDGDVNVSNYNLDIAKNNNIRIHAVALGEGANSSALKKYAEKTNGEFFIVKTAVELEAIYDKLSANNQLNFNNLSDTDNDGVPDDIEISGVPMPNGKLVFLNPTDPDTDNDGLYDGKEVGKMRRGYYVPSNVPDYAVTYKFSFDITSDPTLEDSDNDGIEDCEDNRSLIKGIYSDKAGEIVIGELAIISTAQEWKIWSGHAFFGYQSYINDTLDFSGFYGGYDSKTDNVLAKGKYKIGRDEYISFGGAANDTGIKQSEFGSEADGSIGYPAKSLNAGSGKSNGSSNSSTSSGSGSSSAGSSGFVSGAAAGGSSASASGSGSSGTGVLIVGSGALGAASGVGFGQLEGGIFFNRELHGINTGYSTYEPNFAITHEVTEKQLNELIGYLNDNNSYSFLGHNCTTVARGGWNKIFDDDLNSELLGIDTPTTLMNCLEARGGVSDYLWRIRAS